ncbi:hypothetical protein AGABI2DRAFT_141360 [Agaricus bisporus var. bisporus H97]|uniref:hypothetical protein n=1 Tax=Agaricus bisporus var. bisporus (strain H97 / ATCC MYA-4626 / FGSC 10389) TaxID=936046 RepID=UPI00029F6369|nr:hypothetical protein AGABI2DRAFT_141360 [Agaricus bisporus var. bisporus H97]EKV50521.1 hypothetical protein AGABI2DRAFT_141360 [Agaricus bisporus var. bisporus H97]
MIDDPRAKPIFQATDFYPAYVDVSTDMKKLPCIRTGSPARFDKSHTFGNYGAKHLVKRCAGYIRINARRALPFGRQEPNIVEQTQVNRSCIMPGYHDLPEEIILEIVKFATPIYPTGDRIGSEELCNLRLVSKRFDNLVCPLLFSTLRLRFKDAPPYHITTADYIRSQEIVKALAAGSTTVFHHTKKLYLTITILDSAEKEDKLSARTFLSDHIFNGICGLKNLRTINWYLNSRPHIEELAFKVLGALSTITSFQSFEEFYLGSSSAGSHSLTLEPLSNLTIFRAQWEWHKPEHLIREIAFLLSRCPGLTELALRDRPSSQCGNPALREFFSQIGQLERPWKLQKLELKSVAVAPDDIRAYIHHLKHLTFLEILRRPGSDAATNFGEIWDILRRSGIALKGLSTDSPDDTLFLRYLSSYSGLTSLRLKASYKTPDIVSQICVQVLPNHAETLECLELRCLYIDVSSKAFRQGDDVSLFEMWFEAGLQLSNLTDLFLLPSKRNKNKVYFSTLKRVLLKYHKERGLKFGVNGEWEPPFDGH